MPLPQYYVEYVHLSVDAPLIGAAYNGGQALKRGATALPGLHIMEPLLPTGPGTPVRTAHTNVFMIRHNDGI